MRLISAPRNPLILLASIPGAKILISAQATAGVVPKRTQLEYLSESCVTAITDISESCSEHQNARELHVPHIKEASNAKDRLAYEKNGSRVGRARSMCSGKLIKCCNHAELPNR
jgi:hypothetical protein